MADLIHHADLTAEYRGMIETYAGNGVFNISDDSFVALTMECMKQDGAQTLYSLAVLHRLGEMRAAREVIYRKAVTQLRGVQMPDGSKPWWPDVEKAMEALPRAANALGIQRQSATDLLKSTFTPLKWLAAGLIHEGNIIFAGKSKRGKSWIALNIAVALATGQEVFGHYEVPAAVKVAYCALEDGPRRVYRRLTQMEAHTHDLSKLDILFKMPSFQEGGIEVITGLVEEGVQLIIIDVLAKVEGQGKNGAKDYLEAYETFAPLVELRNQHSFTLVMITHLRKAEAQEMSDAVMGSTAYVGAQDVVWTFTRRQGEHSGFLEIADKDMAEKTVELTFQEQSGWWTFVGEGDEYAASKEEHEVVTFLREEGKPQSILQIMQGVGVPQVKYHTFRKRLQRMVADGLVIRTDRGLYAALGQEGWYRMDEQVPF